MTRTSPTVVKDRGPPLVGLRDCAAGGAFSERAVVVFTRCFGCAAPTATCHSERDSESSTSADSWPPVSALRT